MSNVPNFWRDDERALADAFVRDGYVILPTESREDLDRIRDLMADIAASYLKLPHPEDKGAFLDRSMPTYGRVIRPTRSSCGSRM